MQLEGLTNPVHLSSCVLLPMVLREASACISNRILNYLSLRFARRNYDTLVRFSCLLFDFGGSFVLVQVSKPDLNNMIP